MSIYKSPKLGIGPMSSEVIEAVFRYSTLNRRPIMLVSTKNQIDYKNGYVNNWNTSQYSKFIKTLKKKYIYSNVMICRDHCGPGFNGNYFLKDVYKTISSDIENNFDLIHIDFSKYKKNYSSILKESKKAILFAQSLKKDIKIEVGTDENSGSLLSPFFIKDIINEINFFLEFIKPEFYVLQTGSLVLENFQVGKFNSRMLNLLLKKIKKQDIKIKEHNADYLNGQMIAERKKIINAMNIAPQFGVSQTMLVLSESAKYGINVNNYLNKSYESKKWSKWLFKSDKNDKYKCALLAGHYNFNSTEYKKIEEELNKYIDIKEVLINSHYSIIEHYENNF